MSFVPFKYVFSISELCELLHPHLIYDSFLLDILTRPGSCCETTRPERPARESRIFGGGSYA